VSACFLSLVKAQQQTFASKSLPFLNKLASKVSIYMKMCKSNSYADGRNNMRQNGKDAVTDVVRTCEPLLQISLSDPDQGDTNPMAVDVPGLDENDDYDVPVVSSSATSTVVSEGRVVDTVKQYAVAELGGVQSQAQFFQALKSICAKINEFKLRNDRMGSSASLFVADGNGLVCNPLLKHQFRNDGHVFNSQFLNDNASIRPGCHVQSMAESLLHEMARHNSIDYANAIARALADPQTSDHQVAAFLSEASDPRYSRGAVRKAKLLYNGRMCCDNPACKQNMCLLSTVLGRQAGDVETLWNVHFRLLGAFSMSLRARPDAATQSKALEFSIKGGKEVYVQSTFFAWRQSNFIGTATSLVVLHGRRFFDSTEREKLKHDLSVQAIAVSMGFWEVYFGPCFAVLDGAPRTLETLRAFAAAVATHKRSFDAEKGNAAIDATLLYRRAQYVKLAHDAEDKDAFAANMQCGAGSAFVPVPHIPPDAFKREANLNVFSVVVSECLAYATSSNRANSSVDDALVRNSESSSLSYDSLLACVRSNKLGFGTFYEAEAGLRSLNSDEVAEISDTRPERDQTRISNIKARACDIGRENILDLVDSVAHRIESVVPGFWVNTWSCIPALKSLPGHVAVHGTRHHAAGALLKRIDNTHYEWTDATASDGSGPTAATGFADPDTETRHPAVATRDRSFDVVQNLLDLEVALSVLMHGTNKTRVPSIGTRVVAEKQTCDVDMAISSAFKRGTWRDALLNLYDPTFLVSVLDFCDNAVIRLMDFNVRNQAPCVDEKLCPVAQCAVDFFDHDLYVKRAVKLHVNRLSLLVANKTKLRTCDAYDYFESGQAQLDVFEDGERGTCTYPKSKRSSLSQQSALLSRVACKGYDLLAALVGLDCIEYGFNNEFMLQTPVAVRTRFFVIPSETPDEDSVIAILKAANLFIRCRKSLLNRVSSYTESSGETTGGCSFLVPLANWFDSTRARHWYRLDDVERLVSSEMERIQRELDRRAVAIHAAEREAKQADYVRRNKSQKQYQSSLEKKYKDEEDRLYSIYASAASNENALQLSSVQKRRKNMEAIAASLQETGATGFDFYTMRGLVAYVTGAHLPRGAPPAHDFFLEVYKQFANSPSVPTDATREACQHLLRNLTSHMVKLNTNRTTFSEVPAFYRHPVIVKFLAYAAIRYGTIREQQSAQKIVDSGVCFLTHSFQPGRPIKIFDAEDKELPDDPNEESERADRMHARQVREERRMAQAKRDEAEEEEASQLAAAREAGADVSARVRRSTAMARIMRS
jgi:hypothetical protein